jgi:hypothetical protein
MSPAIDLQSVNTAKNEYLLRLNKTIAPFVLKFISDTYNAAVAKVGHRLALRETQTVLKEVPTWNSVVIRERTAAIELKEPALFSVITAAFVSFVKILSSIRLSDSKPTMKLKVPPADKFVHRVYVLASKRFYQTPNLMRPNPTDVDHVQEQWCAVYDAVENAVRDMLPMKDILSVYLSSAVDENDMVNPVLSPTGSDRGDDDLPAPPSSSSSSDDEQEQRESKIISYDQPQPIPQPAGEHTGLAPIAPVPICPTIQPSPFPPVNPASDAPQPQMQTTYQQPVAVTQPPAQPPAQPLFADAEDGDEHFS